MLRYSAITWYMIFSSSCLVLTIWSYDRIIWHKYDHIFSSSCSVLTIWSFDLIILWYYIWSYVLFMRLLTICSSTASSSTPSESGSWLFFNVKNWSNFCALIVAFVIIGIIFTSIIFDELTSEGRTVEMGSAEAKPIMVWGRSSSVAMTKRNIGEVEDVLVMVTVVMVMVENDVGKIRWTKLYSQFCIKSHLGSCVQVFSIVATLWFIAISSSTT